METQNTDKKLWSKPTVLTLDISNDTYTAKGTGEKEVGQGGGENKSKSIPS